ncbi:MAG: efflux RND transporter periplasmic adaptor subunit [Granulosicoccus sp.]|nr:efflux RND transporter periplasmic adaptor subunit [Granulosicoccus sp.]
MWKRALGALMVLVVVAASYWWQRGESAWAVDTVAVVRGSIESRLQLTGTVINDRTVTLTALLDGEIMAIRAREGDVVEAGTVLAELDSRQAQALLDKAGAELILHEQLLEAATRTLERIERLSREGNASQQALDESRDAKLEAEASLKAAAATLALNQLRLDNAQIKSPFAGTVIEQSAETGQWLEAGTPLFKVVATEGTVIEANVSASDWSRVSIGQPVVLSSEVDAGTRWSSEISWIAPTVTDVSGQGKTVAVRMFPGKAAPSLLLGQEVDVDVSLQRVDDILIVPLQALQEVSPGEFRAFVLDGGRARERPVTIGLTSLDDAELVDGLAEGDRVIVPNGQTLLDGQDVRLR